MGLFSSIGKIFGGGGGSSSSSSNQSNVTVNPKTEVNIPLNELATALKENAATEIAANKEIASSQNKTLANLKNAELQTQLLAEKDKNEIQEEQNQKRNYQILLGIIIIGGAAAWKGLKNG